MRWVGILAHKGESEARAPRLPRKVDSYACAEPTAVSEAENGTTAVWEVYFLCIRPKLFSSTSSKLEQTCIPLAPLTAFHSPDFAHL